ncbi:MAG: S-layer protein [Methanomicrobiaceae archaeon]|nr:S-layer protein [Methanomicrobiaceae archaeon]
MNVRSILLLAVLISLISAPALAGEKYLYGSPELTATIAGTNEFAPGASTALTVVIENRGLNEVKIVQPTIITRDDLPTTAKMVRVTLDPEDAPFSVKTDTQMVGDIAGGASTQAAFSVTFDNDAAPGVYTVPLSLEYTYLSFAEQFGLDTMKYTYTSRHVDLPLQVRVASDLAIDVIDIRTDSLNVGTEGYLTLQVRHTGHEQARAAVVRIAQDQSSPLAPTDSSVYVGSFAPGEVVECTFKVAVSGNADEQVYPLNVFVEYKDETGSPATSGTEKIGVQVGGKIDFSVVSEAATLSPGDRDVINVTYKNTGAATVYTAQARLSAVDPFSSSDDTAFLGDLGPGETATAVFEVSVDSGATVKTYGLDSEIRYRDALDNSQISDTMKVRLQVLPRSSSAAFLTNPLFISLIVVLLAGIGYYVVKRRKGT